MMPASPWIGSSSTATVSSSIAWASAAASPNGTERNPGVNGPKPSRAVGSDEKLTMLIVRPWKLSSATMIFARPAGTPLTSAPHLRATLRPLSTASAPEFIGSTMSLPHNWASAAQNGPRLAEWNARLPSVTVSSWGWGGGGIFGVGGRGDLRVAMAEVDRRVGGQTIQVAPAVDIGDPRALGACRHHG